MKISMKRIAALVVALVMVIGLLPVMNNAVDAVDVTGLTDGTIGLSYNFTGSHNENTSGWTANGNAITGTLQGVKKAAIYMNATTTLTITNNKSAEANLSFDYSVTTTNGGSATIDDVSVTSGSFEKKLAAGESVKVVLNVARTTNNKDNAMSISITNLILASASNDPVTTTFEAPAFGSYTVAYGDQTLTVAAGTPSQTATNLPSVSYTLSANVGSGYKLVGWYNVTKDAYLGTEMTYTGSFEEACTVKAVIVPKDAAVFMAGANYFTDLNEAVEYAVSSNLKQITLVQSGILPAGDYTIPAGITLLIPMDTEYTPTRTDDEDFGVAPEYTTDVVTPYAFLTLTMADGVNMTVNGTLDVESKHTSLQGSKNTGGRPCGPYGAIYMNPNATITVNSGANLFAWGYVYGDGAVTASSGAKVYEIMQVTDFPGGSNMSMFVDTDPTFDFDGDGNPANDYIKTFPFSQYYVQNIEVALTLNAGAAEYVYITMTAGGQSMGLPVRFIGEGGMFVPGEGGTIVKDYDPSTDRLNVTVNGDSSMAGIALDLTGTKYEGAVEDVLQTSKVDSASFILTLNGNITINIASGTTTVKQDLSLLPGVEINIAENATLIVAERTYADNEQDNLTVFGSYTGYNIYVWDLDNWGKYVFGHKYLSAVTYSPTSGRYTRTQKDLKDVKIDINGTVICEGYIYSTVNFDDELWMPVDGAGAQVISTGKTGVLVLQNGPGPEDMAYCLEGSSNVDGAVFVDSVWLQNGDGSYVLTEGCEPGTTYCYCDVHDLWYTEGHGNCVMVNTFEVTWIVNGVGAPEEYLLGAVPSYKGGVPTKPANGCVSYTFAGWATSANGAVLTELPAVTGDAVYFAIFTESTAHVGDNDQDHWCDGTCGDRLSSCVDANQDHKCDYTGCQVDLSSCEDGNMDHKCDYTGCNKIMSTCIDTDKDHYCDYIGCDDKISICADTNYDHKCDYVGCQETISSCIDANNDHKCDYAGCKANITACRDLNQDHKCDYAGCQAVLTACQDADEDHLCDYAGCQERMSNCVDNDQDHYCDLEGCNVQTSDCVDRNSDHKCDYTGCNKVMSNCVDTNQDHKCDYVGCRKVLSSCTDTNQDHKCDYTGCKKTLSSCEDKNYDHLCDFAKCDNVLSSCVDNNADHKCDFAGCQATMSECRDDNLDHYCDYQTNCGKKLSNCVDANEDHYCDYEGCKDLLTECVDNDFDHLCDFAGCNEIASICEDMDEDHFCDYVGCGERTSYCEDENLNHYCDYVGCEGVLSVCEDADQNHCCDYEGCGNVTSTCEDLDNNHYCDYEGCGEELSTCVDNNEDHKCDYNGCNAKLSNCIDANRDHYCDYAGCKAKLSSCIDIDYDHLCDYVGCGDVLTQCRDFDEDHFCDYYNCLAEMSVCEDADNDHYCDYIGCGMEMSDCDDADNDHYCDYAGCGERLSDCEDADNNHYCDYEGCQRVVSDHNWVAPDCVNNGYCDICGGPGESAKGHGFNKGWEYVEDSEVHNVICKDCYDYSYTEAHSYDENHNCVCGSVEFYTITFMDGNKVHTTFDAHYGLPANFYGMPIPQAPTGYEWAGWYTADGIRVNPGTVWNRDVVCYATWSKIVYTVNWTVDGSSTQENYEYGAEINFAAPSKTGYTFTGWEIDGEIYQTTDSYIVTGAVTATATWQINSYKITFRVNGIVSNVETVVYGTQITQHWLLSKGLCNLNGYSLLGWTVTYSIKQNPNNYNFTMPAQDFYADAILAINTYTVTWIVDGTSITETYNYGEMPSFKGSTDKANDGCVVYAFTGWDKELVSVTGNETYTALYSTGTSHLEGVRYTDNENGTHNGVYGCCGTAYVTNEAHSYVDSVCVCGAVASYTLTVHAMDDSVLLSTNVPYGVNVYNYVKDLVGGSVPVNVENQIGELVFTGWMDINANPIVDGYTMPAEDLDVVSNFAFTGWIKYGYIDGWVYESLDQIQKIGWTEIDGSWYYLDTETGIRAEGLTRVSYPSVSINGITYAPNMEDVKYANDKGISFLDATTGLFLFDENGKFLPGYTGLVGDSYAVNGYLVWHYGLVEINGNYYYFIGDVNNGGNVMVKGCDYNVGRNTATNRSFVIGGLYTFGADGAMCMYEGITNVNGVLRYYEDAQLMLGKGLTQVGENVIYVNAYGALIVDAEYYIGANDKGVDKGIYYFDADGFIVIPEAEPGKEGLHFEDGKWFYYVDGAKAYCAGLIEIDGNLVYVKSDGSLATGVYYVTNTNGHASIASGTKCTFDDNGILIDPFLGEKIVEEGSIQNLYELSTEVVLNANGKLTIDVSNIYMVTGREDLGFDVTIWGLDGSYYSQLVRGEGTAEFDLPAGEYTVCILIAYFDEDGGVGYGKGGLDYKITFIGDGSPLNGIVGGYYYVNGHIGYAAGLIELDGIYYYVRSNGQIVTDCQYWITNVNDTGFEPGLYEFDVDGWMYEIYVETFTGIKDGYFYIEDEVAYAAGLMKYNGGYIYVRSNGQVATGKYWITNHNGLLPEGFYDFGENGIYYPALPENAQLLMEVNKNVDTDGLWDSNAIANAIRASADGHIFIEVTDVTFEDEIYGQGGFCIDFDGSWWVYQWEDVYKVGTGVVMIPVSANEDVICFVNPADISGNEIDFAYGTISYKIWSDVDCELVQGSAGE